MLLSACVTYVVVLFLFLTEVTVPEGLQPSEAVPTAHKMIKTQDVISNTKWHKLKFPNLSLFGGFGTPQRYSFLSSFLFCDSSGGNLLGKGVSPLGREVERSLQRDIPHTFPSPTLSHAKSSHVKPPGSAATQISRSRLSLDSFHLLHVSRSIHFTYQLQ